MHLIRKNIIGIIITILFSVRQICARNRHHTLANMHLNLKIILIILLYQSLMVCTLKRGRKKGQTKAVGRLIKPGKL